MRTLARPIAAALIAALAVTCWLLVSFRCAGADDSTAWPPELPGAELPGAEHGRVTIRSDLFLQVPAAVALKQREEGAASFDVAKVPPTVDLAFHDSLGPAAASRRLWSSWGDICVASDGRVYCGIGDHGNAVGGDARCFVYCWDPRQKRLRQVVDMNRVVAPASGQPAWSKIHAKIDEGSDRKIYFSCTLNDGNRAKNSEYGWNAKLPGGQLYQFDPATGRTRVFASLPPRRCTATSILDRRRNVWWCNLEAGQGDAMWALDLNTAKPVFQSPDGAVAFNRNFALARDGSIYFNGERSISRIDRETGKTVATRSRFPDDSPGMRCSTRESRDGWIYGMTHRTSQLFRFAPKRDELSMLGPNWLGGSYTTVCVLSPDERYLYYLPGSHGKAFHDGTPVIQYDIAGARRKVLAFLAPVLEQSCNYVPGGAYGVKLSADGAVLYVNFNGHAADSVRPERMRPNGFGLCAFVAVHIPLEERGGSEGKR